MTPAAADAWRLAGKALFALLFIAGGVGHFAATDFYAKMVPPYLPAPRALVLVSGACEVALGLFLLWPPTTRAAAWGLVALLVAVFPANVHVFRHQDEFPLPPLAHLLRLPLQALLILWAYAYAASARPNHPRRPR